MVDQLETIADEIIFTTFAFDRAISADKLASYSKKESKLVFENWKEAIDTKVEMIGENDVFYHNRFSLFHFGSSKIYSREKLDSLCYLVFCSTNEVKCIHIR